MARFDQAYTATDKRLKEMEKQIRKEYGQAIKEVEGKLEDYMRRYEIKDEKWRAWVKEGKKTEAQYRQWRMGQIAMSKRWSDMRDKLAKVYVNADRAAYAYINKNVAWIYAENYNFSTYQIEKTLNVDTSFLLYDEGAVMRLMADDPEMLPPPSRTKEKEIQEGKLERWNKQKMQSVMVQGIIQGSSVIEIAKNMAEKVGEMDLNSAIRNARTMTTAAQNAGRVDSYKRAASMGIELQQRWVAVLDDRTRHAHREMDGQTVDVGKPFKYENYELRFPSDPFAPAFLVYNCRCCVNPVLKGFAYDHTDLSLRNTTHMTQQTYEEWKKAKPKYKPIDEPIKTANRMKAKYVKEYRTL